MPPVGQNGDDELFGLGTDRTAPATELAGILPAIEDDKYNPTLTDRLTAPKAEKAEAEATRLEPAPDAGRR
jgi:hypothetical protein